VEKGESICALKNANRRAGTTPENRMPICARR
jgi:hypothetical protein